MDIWFGMVALGLILIFITKLLSKQICLCHYLFRVEPGLICKVGQLILVKPFIRPSTRITGELWLNPSLFMNEFIILKKICHTSSLVRPSPTYHVMEQPIKSLELKDRSKADIYMGLCMCQADILNKDEEWTNLFFLV